MIAQDKGQVIGESVSDSGTRIYLYRVKLSDGSTETYGSDHEPDVDEDTMPAPARDAWLRWYATLPDAPCIAICSTSQGDDICKGCGRTFDEVQHWPVMTPAEKRVTWRR